MNKLKIYHCPTCHNIIADYGNAKLDCCESPLSALTIQKGEMGDSHSPIIEDCDGEWFVKFDHSMDKGHHLAAVFIETYDRLLHVRLFPEQEASLHLHPTHHAKIYVVCSSEGVFVYDV